MNREFEKQYKEYMEGQVPDLWDRIESGLKDKTCPAGETEQKGKGILSIEKFESGNSVKKRIPAVRRKGMAGIIAAAAVLVLCFTIPWFSVQRGDGSDGYSSNAGGAAQNNSMSAKDEEMADNGGEAAEYAGSAKAPVNEAVSEGGKSDAGEEGFGKGRIKLRVSIDGVKEAADAEYGFQCHAVVLDAEENPGVPKEEVSFYVNGETEMAEGDALEAGRECEVVLRRIDGEETYFAEEICFPETP